MTRREELKELLVNSCEYHQSEVEQMSNSDLVDAWLIWEGIIGYTGEILDLIEAAYGIELNNN